LGSRFLKQSLLTASLVTIGANVLSRVFGYVREAVIADFYGTSAILDTFILAFTVPEILSFVVLAALPTALIPTAQTVGGEDKDRESSLFWRGLAAFTALLAVLSLGIYILRVPLLEFIGGGLAESKMPLASELTRILAFFLFCRGVEAYFRGWVYKKKHFVVPSLSPFVLNVTVLVSIYALHAEWDIRALAWGLLVGAALQLIVNGVIAFWVVKPRLSPGARAAIGPLVAMTFSVAAVELISFAYPVVDRYLASRYLGEGQIAALRYSLFITQLAPGMLVATFATASFPWISDISASPDRQRLMNLYRDSVGLIVFAMVPITAGLLAFGDDIVRVAYERGQFDAGSRHLTVGPFLAYAAGLVFYSIYIYQMRYYYARRLMLRLGVILGGMLLIKTVGSVALVGPLGHVGLAVATSFAWTAGFVIMTIDLSRQLGWSVMAPTLKAIARTIPFAAIALLYWLGLRELWPSSADDSLLRLFVRLLTAGATGALIYFAAAFIMKQPEPRRMIEMLRSKCGGKGAAS